MAGPRGQDCHAAPPPPPAVRRRRQGTKGPPPLPPPPPTGPRAGGGAAPPPPAPTPAGEPQARPSAPPGPGGRPPPRKDGDAVGGAAAGPAPANPHRRAGATRTTEQEGGRAPHDPPVTTARSGMTEGGFRSARASGRAVYGPPLTPPHPGAALQPRPHAHAGRERAGATEGARMEYRRPAPGRRAGRPRRDSPPPRPPTGPQAAGAPAPTPRGRGDGPPPPERGVGVRPAPPPQPPARIGAAKNKRAHACAPGRRTDRTQRSLVSTNRSGMGGHAPHGQHNASDARFVACPGKAEGRNEAERPPALQAPPRPHNRGVRRTPPPPQPAPQHMNATDPPCGAQPPQGQSRAPTPARPRPQHVDRGPRQPAQWAGSRGRGSA